MTDDEGSIVAQPSKSPSCGACRTRDSSQWWKAPKGLSTTVLCDHCGQNWRKYADLNVRPLREESVPATKSKAVEKREGTPLAGPREKRVRTSASASASVTSTPPPSSISVIIPPSASSSAPQIKCVCCHKQGPLGKVLQCKKCHFRTHAGSIGAVVDPASVADWTCELCENEETLEASVNPDCLLCPRVANEEKKNKPWPPADSFLRACKPTEGQGWTHVLCAVFMSELTFTDASRLRLVEGLSTIGRHRWTTRCCLCGETEGAVVKCNDCVREFHVSCAWKQGHKFGFEIQPVKSSRRDTTIIATFKGESGSMNPIISCREHDHAKRDIYRICETNEGGESALQVYCHAYKQAQVGQAHGLLRKAKRLDAILNLRTEMHVAPSPAPTTPEPECWRCSSQFSPCFYPFVEVHSSSFGTMQNGASSSSNLKYLCHKCHFETSMNDINGKTMGMMVS